MGDGLSKIIFNKLTLPTGQAGPSCQGRTPLSHERGGELPKRVKLILFCKTKSSISKTNTII